MTDKIELLKIAINKYEDDKTTLDCLLIGLRTQLALLEIEKEKESGK